MITLVSQQSVVLHVNATDAFGNPANDTFNWTCEPAGLLNFQEGGGQSASGSQVTLRSAGAAGSGTVTVTGLTLNQYTTESVQVNAGPAVSLTIVAG